MAFPGFNKINTLAEFKEQEAFKKEKQRISELEFKEDIQRAESRGMERASRKRRFKEFAGRTFLKAEEATKAGIRSGARGLFRAGKSAIQAQLKRRPSRRGFIRRRKAPRRSQGYFIDPSGRVLRVQSPSPRRTYYRPTRRGPTGNAFDLLLGSSPRRPSSTRVSDRGSDYDLVGPDLGIDATNIFGGRQRKGKQRTPRSLFDF